MKWLLFWFPGVLLVLTGHAQVNPRDTVTVYTKSAEYYRFKEIPDSVFTLKNLKVLGIGGMDCDAVDRANCWCISIIPKKIKRLKKLEVLRISLSRIRKLPRQLKRLKYLKVLDLDENLGLSDIAIVTELSDLEELVLYDCYLDSLPKDIGKLKKLKYLGLTGNTISPAELARIKAALPQCEVVFSR
ncbi:MAG: leucine-rich repeat domain-containing protein [Bacteroidetes bacterium]|nr:leucine-rich repeat domain-containing protein [Bacteroidota bacterium]